MRIVTFIIAIIALIISILAYRRTGGAKELKQKVDSLSSSMESLKERAGVGLKEQVDHLTAVTESIRDRTASAVDRLEKAVRRKPEEKPPEKKLPEKKAPKPRRPRAKKG
jgi:FtsZ-interacting cell division protein ZipA